jgi:hypothetical protein
MLTKKKKSKVMLLNNVPARAHRRPSQLDHVSSQPLPNLGNAWTVVASHMKAPPMRPHFLEIKPSSLKYDESSMLWSNVKPKWLDYKANKKHPSYGKTRRDINNIIKHTIRLVLYGKRRELDWKNRIKKLASEKGYNVNILSDLVIFPKNTRDTISFEVRPKGSDPQHERLAKPTANQLIRETPNNQRTFARLSKAHARAMQNTKPGASDANKKKALNSISHVVAKMRQRT